MTLQETVAEIKRQGGLVYVPHPFDRHALGPRLRAPAADPRRRRRDRGLQPARGDRRLQRGGRALRRQVPDRRRAPARTRTSPRASARCASGCATSTGPQEFLQSLRDADILTRPTSLLYVQALKFLQTRATPAPARRASAARRVKRALRRHCGGRDGRGGSRGRARAPAVDPRRAAGAQLLMHRQGQARAPSKPSGSMPVTDDEIREKYLERAIRELNTLTRELQACPHCPRGNLMPVLGSGHPQADIMLLKYAAAALGDRGGRRLLRPRRRRADEVAQAPLDRSARRLRHAVRQVPAQRRLAGRPRLRRAGRRGDRDRAAEDHRRDGRRGAGRARRAGHPARARRCSRAWARSSSSRRRSTPCTCPTSTTRSTSRTPSARSGRPSACSASGTPHSRRIEAGRAQTVRTILPSLPPAAKRS